MRVASPANDGDPTFAGIPDTMLIGAIKLAFTRHQPAGTFPDLQPPFDNPPEIMFIVLNREWAYASSVHGQGSQSAKEKSENTASLVKFWPRDVPETTTRNLYERVSRPPFRQVYDLLMHTAMKVVDRPARTEW